jgi:hypothetical protein
LDDLYARYKEPLFMGKHSQNAVDNSEEMIDAAWYQWTHPIRDTRFAGDPANWWKKIPGLKGEPPVDLTKDNFWGHVWDAMEIEGDMPRNFGRKNCLDYLWDIKTKPAQKMVWEIARDTQFASYKQFLDEISQIMGTDYSKLPHVQSALTSIAKARAMDDVIIIGDKLRSFSWRLMQSDNVPGAIRTMSGKYGIASVSTKGKYFDDYIINVIKKHGENLPETFNRLQDITFSDAIVAFENYRASKNWPEVIPGIKRMIGEIDDIPIDEAARRIFGTIPDAIPPTYDGGPISIARATWEQLGGIRGAFDDLANKIKANYGKFIPAPDAPENAERLTDAMERYLTGYTNDAGKYMRGAIEGIEEAKLLAAKTGNAMRDFTLHTYPKKTNLDLALSYIMPYQFWYSRTYQKWFTERLVRNSNVIASYMRYKDTMAQVHAGAPEWWKYNINTNELLGLDSQHPLFFNLEATLNPLNGLTGVDFNDPMRRVNWWTSAVDHMQKYGPSLWTPISIATAWALYQKGEQEAVEIWNGREYTGEDYREAAARWAGRLFPQTRTLKAATSLLGGEVRGPFGITYGPGLETDILVWLFSGGVDPYERRRIGRALGTLSDENPDITQAQLMDAANNQSGRLWDQAASRAQALRAFGQISSFFFGVGFKGRNPEDMVTDSFYQDWYNLWKIEPNYSPDEFRNMMELMRQKYPFMDTLLLSRKGGSERDRAFSYNVLARIPPGLSYELATTSGMNPDLLNRFYEDKGKISSWPEEDRDNFLTGIAVLGGMLEVPDTATRQEYSAAKSRYSDMRDEIIDEYGDYIWEKIDYYYNLKEKDTVSAREWLDENPDVQGALDTKTEMVLTDPLLMSYYGSIETVSGFYQGKMWEDIENQLGSDIWDKWDEWHALEEFESPRDILVASDPFYQQYWDLQDWYEEQEDLIGEQLRVEFPGIDDLWDGWDDAKDEGRGRAYWNAHPELEAYMDRKDELLKQLGGEDWYEFRELYWDDDYIDQKWAIYDREKAKGGDPQSEYWDSHPELEQYMHMKEDWITYTNEQLVFLQDKLPEGIPPEVRTQYPRSEAGQAVLEALQPQAPTLTYEQWEIIFGIPVTSVVASGNIPEEAYPMLEDYAAQMGITVEQLIIAIRNSTP